MTDHSSIKILCFVLQLGNAPWARVVYCMSNPVSGSNIKYYKWLALPAPFIHLSLAIRIQDLPTYLPPAIIEAIPDGFLWKWFVIAVIHSTITRCHVQDSHQT